MRYKKKNKFLDKKTLIIIESPLQLLCAYEAISFFKIDYKLYIRLSDSKSTNLQMLNITRELNFENVNYINIPTTRNFLSILKIIKYLIIFKFSNFDYYIIGNYLSGFFNQFIKIISKEKIILLDDGVATFKIQRELISKSLPLTLFTMFEIDELKGQEIYNNTFITLKTLYLESKQYKDIFIGGKLVELGFLSTDSYVRVIKRAIKNSKENGILYFPHREASKELLNKIEKLDNLEIVHSKSTIEFYLLKNGIKPNYIYSLLSSALFSLSIIFKEVKVIAYKPKFNRNHREGDIEKVYGLIKKHKLIKLETI